MPTGCRIKGKLALRAVIGGNTGLLMARREM
jgi:hypothetical protein